MPEIELKDLLEKQNKAFAEFRDANDKRLKSLEDRGSVDPLLEEKVDKANAEITRLSKLLGDFGRNKGVTLVLFNDQGEVVAHPEIVDIARPDGNGQLRLAKLDELGSPMMNTVWGQFRNPGSASLADLPPRPDLVGRTHRRCLSCAPGAA